MNSNQGQTNRIERMIEELNMRERFESREDMLIHCVSTRLDESLASYLHDLDLAQQSILSSKNDIRTLRKLNKI